MNRLNLTTDPQATRERMGRATRLDRPATAPESATEHPARDRLDRLQYRTILVPLDGTSLAEHALPHAIALARKGNAVLQLVHVYRPWDPGYHRGRLYSVDALQAADRRRRQVYLQRVAAQIAKIAPIRVLPVVVEGRDVAERLRAAANGCADLVVMATRARSRLARAVRGSISAEILRGLNVPLLVVRGRKSPPNLAY